jgi:thiol-disulfide isomerase/thioredoxin
VSVSSVQRVVGFCLVALLTTTVAACSSGDVNDSPGGNGLTYIEGDGTVSVIPPPQRVAAPQITGTTLDGRPYSSSSDAGQVIVANVWASWCAPCRAEAPALAQLSKDFAQQSVSFVGINTRDQEAAARAFVQRFGVRYPSIADPDGTLMLQFGTSAPRNIPSTLVIDRQGRIAATVAGSITYSGLRELIQRVVAEPS